MKIRFLGDLTELSDGIAVISEMLDVEIADGEYVFEVTHTDENKLTVTLDGKKGTIVYNARCAFFRAFGLAVEHIRDGEENFEIVEPVHFDMNGPMFDVSQGNAAFNMKTMKSILRQCALMGLSMAMLQLGMFVPARSATISLSDGIFTHFPTGADDTIDKGRLGEECARLRDIFNGVTKNSIVLLDESLSSTGSYEASYIAAEVLAGLSRVRCRCLFSTHLHELASEIDGINARTAPDGAFIDTLVAGIEEGKRSFKIHRMKPDGKSYARDIADKYGLSYENIVKNILKS